MWSSRSLTTPLAFCLLCLFFLSVLKQTSAAPTRPAHPEDVSSSTLVERGNGKEKSAATDITPTKDGGTSDKSPGIGVEFETNALTFSNDECPLNDAFKSKAKEISGRKDENNHWALTVDTTSTAQGNVHLTGEYILNGKLIKLGTQDAGRAAQAASDDLVRFHSHWELIVMAKSLNNQMQSIGKIRSLVV